jgi:hypothetical protein
VCSSTRCTVGSFERKRKKIQHTTGKLHERRILTGLSERDLRQQLKKYPSPIIFDGGGGEEGVCYC